MVEQQPDDNDHMGRLQWLYEQTQEQGWDGYDSPPTTKQARQTTETMLMVMHVLFDKEVMDRFFVVPLGDGFCIEFMDPRTGPPRIGPDGDVWDNARIPSSSFDTIVDGKGDVMFWRSENLHWNGHSLQSDYDFESEIEMPDAGFGEVMIEWVRQAKEFHTHIKEELNDTTN